MCLHLAYFLSHIFTFLRVRCHSDLMDNSKTVMWSGFISPLWVWLDKMLLEWCNHWSCLLILFVYVSMSLRYDRTCLHSKYLQLAWLLTSLIFRTAVVTCTQFSCRCNSPAGATHLQAFLNGVCKLSFWCEFSPDSPVSSHCPEIYMLG